jgi:sensor histidine kinase regulating citrate/malate metabolism
VGNAYLCRQWPGHRRAAARELVFWHIQQFHFHTEGKGLSLYLEKTQAVAINAKIEFQSKEGEGSVFTVLLPVKLPTYP